MNKKAIIIPIVTFLVGGAIGAGAIYGAIYGSKSGDKDSSLTGAGPQILPTGSTETITDTGTEVLTDSLGIGGKITYTYYFIKEVHAKDTDNEVGRLVSMKFVYEISGTYNVSEIEDYDIKIMAKDHNINPGTTDRCLNTSRVDDSGSNIKITTIGYSNEIIFLSPEKQTEYIPTLMAKKGGTWYSISGEADSIYQKY